MGTKAHGHIIIGLTVLRGKFEKVLFTGNTNLGFHPHNRFEINCLIDGNTLALYKNAVFVMVIKEKIYELHFIINFSLT